MIAVPSTHSYLGEELVDVHNVSILDAEAEVQVPLLRLSGVVLFPGEALPLRITEARYIAHFRAMSTGRGASRASAAPSVIAVMCHFSEPGRGVVGTLADVCSIQCGPDEVRLLTRGRYRFTLLRTHRDDGMLWATARVQDDEPLHRSRRSSAGQPFPQWVYDAHDPYILLQRAKALLEQSNAFSQVEQTEQPPDDPLDREGLYRWLRRRIPRDWAHLESMHALDSDNSDSGDIHSARSEESTEGSSDYEYYTGDEGSDGVNENEGSVQESDDAMELVNPIADSEEANNWGDSPRAAEAQAPASIGDPDEAYHRTEEAEDESASALFLEEGSEPSSEAEGDIVVMLNPVVASFRMAANMVLPDALRQDLLAAPHAVARLRMIIEIVDAAMKKDSQLLCDTCGVLVTSKHLLCKVPGAEGEIGAYVNPHGVVHQTVTFKEVRRGAVALCSLPDATDTWFPGYAWSIACCRHCGSHLGWKFTEVGGTRHRQSESSLHSFWGIRRAALREDNS